MRHETNYNSVNLLYNGGWELVDSKGKPAFWDIDGASQEDDLSVYDVGAEGLRVQITSQGKVTATQSFTEAAGPLDFQTPLAPNSYRGMPYGHQVTPARSVSTQDDLTVSLDISRELGPCLLRVLINGVALVTPEGLDTLSLDDITETRAHFFHAGVPSGGTVTDVAIELTSGAPSEATIDRVQMSLGRYSDQPYTGDPFIQIFPKNCLVMTLGTTCPAGFEELGDGDLAVPAEWTEAEPGIRARVGNYPASGTELAGSPKHGPDNDSTSANSASFEAFESRTGRAASETGVGPNFLTTSNNPLVDQELDHTHTVNKASSRVLAVEYLFCKRV